MSKREKRIGKVVAMASLMAAALLPLSGLAGPIAHYGFSCSQGSYVPLTNPTLMTLPEYDAEASDGVDFNNYLWAGSTDLVEQTDESFDGFPIGFDFLYDSQEMNRFAIASNMGVFLGKDAVQVDHLVSSNTLFNDEEYKDMIQVAVFNNQKLFENTKIGYELIGEAPYRTLVVEFTNVGAQLGWWGDNRPAVSLQIRLNETYNTVEMVFNDWDNVVDCSNSTYVYVYLKGAGSDRQNRYGSESWADTVSSTDSRTTYSASCYPADGLTYTFTPCEDCVTPTVNVSNLTGTAGTDVITGSFEAVDGVDGYLVMCYEANTPLVEPEDGTVYKAGDYLGDDAQVLSVGTATEFSTSGTMVLDPVTDYVVRVYTFNENCMYGPKYNCVDVPSIVLTTCPAAPLSVKATAKSPNSIEVVIEGNDNNDDVYLLSSDEKVYNVYNTLMEEGKFGTPSGDYQVGDELEDGGKVVYVGKAGTVTVSDLDPNTVYHFAAYSRGANGVYSSVYTFDGDVTYGELPYDIDVNEDISGYCIHGVELQSPFIITRDTNRDWVIVGNTTTAVADGAEGYFTTQWIKSSTDGTVRVRFKCLQNTVGLRGATGSPYNQALWDERDSFVVEVTTDGENYTPIRTWNYEDAPEYASTTEYSALAAKFQPGMDTQFRVRLRFTTYKAIKTYIKDIVVEEKPECDTPSGLKASVDGGDVTMSWTPESNETQWALAWRESSSEEWSEKILDTTTATITGLKGITAYDFRVAAQCSDSNRGAWSDVVSVTTGYAVPFEDPIAATDDWTFADGALVDGVTPSDNASWTWYSRWKYLMLYNTSGSDISAWAITPAFNLGAGDQNYVFKFDVTNQSGTEESSTPTIKLVVSKDCESFNTEDVILTIPTEDFSGDGEEYEFTASLKGYTGKVRVGILVEADSDCPTLQLTKIAVEESCPNDVVVTVGDVDHNSAVISWEGTRDEDQCWMVKIRKEDGEWSEYVTTTENSYKFEDLDLRTNYVAAVTKACADDDIAKPAEVTFTTAATAPCEPVANVAVEATPYAVSVSWEGDAYSYNVKLVDVEAESETVVNTKETSYTFDNLLSDTDYKVSVQALCSLAEGDESEYSEPVAVKTLEETCFAPTNIEIVPSYFSTEVTWEGNSDSYELSFRAEGEEDWTVLTTTENMLKITGLTPTTNYTMRMRGLCGEEMASRYSDVYRFATIAVPACGTPSDLEVVSLDYESATLGWTAGDRNDSWQFNYRASSATSWESETLEEPTVTITGLAEESVYIWRVKGYCSEDSSESGWSAQERFTTEANGIASILKNGNLSVKASKSMISILNPKQTLINMVEVYTVDGALMKRISVNTTDNMIFSLGHGNEVIVVRVYSGNQVTSYRVAVK
jgi:hypothetical protein